MNSIQLTKEHKSKLLEMCIELFPEYDFTLDKWKQCFVTLGLKTKDLYETHIHWFEFCFYYILPKLNLEPLWKKSVYEDCFIQALHPVDYLYIGFKKLK